MLESGTSKFLKLNYDAPLTVLASSFLYLLSQTEALKSITILYIKRYLSRMSSQNQIDLKLIERKMSKKLHRNLKILKLGFFKDM